MDSIIIFAGDLGSWFFELESWLRDNTDTILVLARDLGPWLFGILSWFFTGFDDLVIFSNTYHEAETKKEKIEAIAGLMSMVLIMLFLVVSIGWTMGFLREYVWLGGILPLSIAIKTWMDRGKIKEPRKGTYFFMAFAGFGLNCTDDIIYNTGVIAGKAIEYQVWYLGGILTGAVIMVALAHHLFRGMKDMPKLRASVMFLVSGYILYPGIEMIMRMIK